VQHALERVIAWRWHFEEFPPAVRATLAHLLEQESNDHEVNDLQHGRTRRYSVVCSGGWRSYWTGAPFSAR
jgi:rhodanese-related sulfurtransferase